MKTLEKLAEELVKKKYPWLIPSEKKGEWNTHSSSTFKEFYISGWRACREAMLKIPSDKLMKMELSDLANFGEEEASE